MSASVAKPVSISAAARITGISARMLRHYEQQGLIGPIRRGVNGYRQYNAEDLHTLRFIKRARELGFSMTEISELVALWQDKARASASVKHIAKAHMDKLDARIDAMQAMRRTLQHLLQHCHGDARPECPILDDLAGHDPLQ